jgi:tryptophan halogenase
MVENHELFRETNWFPILYGQGLTPQGHHPLADVLSDDDLRLRLSQIRSAIMARVDSLPPHDDYLRQCVAAASRQA